MPPVKRSKREDNLRIVDVHSKGSRVKDAVRIKEEPQSDSGSYEGNFEESSVVKREPESEESGSMSERESPASNTEDHHRSEGKDEKKKRFKRVVVLDDDSDSDGSVVRRSTKSTGTTRITRSSRKKVKVEERGDSSSSEEGRGRGQKRGHESSEEEDSSSGSSSSSSKGVIEFESDSEEDVSEKSYTSSEDEVVDESDLKKECILCRNLGNRDFRHRSRTNNTNWCRCGECRVVGHMRDYDRICCREIKDVVVFLDDEMDDASKKKLCVTKHPRFEIDVLKFKALERTHYYRTQHYGNTLGYQACWSFIRWIWNTLGWGNRMVIPACVKSKIRDKYGSDGVACFTAVTTCEKARHCRQSQI